ncbi:MAG: 2-dehydro-3-deoxygalactonokinase [Sandarakinorhabdus sp.]|nr:2-dehydro-3-deoxygalactonokinase [Sandarakinorhabdus sp.]
MEFIAADWGTTNRRIFHIAADGTLVSRSSDDRGILASRDFPAEIAALRREAGAVPLLLAGMIGSNRGWIETPYVKAPAGLAEIAAGAIDAAAGVAIVPGVLFDDPAHPDVMRGEEVQIIGALALGEIDDGLVCMPGTHSKWVEIEGGQITRFRTIMTGDILAALKARSILSDLLDHEPQCDDVFAAGVDHGLEANDLTAELFTSRARVLTGAMTPPDAASRISGLLIGADVRTGLGRSRADVVPLIGAPALCERFAMALQRAGRESVVIDGEKAFVAGARAIMGARNNA